MCRKWKTLVIFQLSWSPRKIQACFLPARDHSIGRHLHPIIESPAVIVPVFVEFSWLACLNKVCMYVLSVTTWSSPNNGASEDDWLDRPSLSCLLQTLIWTISSYWRCCDVSTLRRSILPYPIKIGYKDNHIRKNMQQYKLYLERTTF